MSTVPIFVGDRIIGLTDDGKIVYRRKKMSVHLAAKRLGVSAAEIRQRIAALQAAKAEPRS